MTPFQSSPLYNQSFRGGGDQLQTFSQPPPCLISISVPQLTCGFIQVTILHAWNEVEEFGQVALCHADRSDNLDTTAVGLDWVVVQHGHGACAPHHARSSPSKTSRSCTATTKQGLKSEKHWVTKQTQNLRTIVQKRQSQRNTHQQIKAMKYHVAKQCQARECFIKYISLHHSTQKIAVGHPSQ